MGRVQLEEGQGAGEEQEQVCHGQAQQEGVVVGRAEGGGSQEGGQQEQGGEEAQGDHQEVGEQDGGGDGGERLCAGIQHGENTNFWKLGNCICSGKIW